MAIFTINPDTVVENNYTKLTTPKEEEESSFGETLGAAFRTETSLGYFADTASLRRSAIEEAELSKDTDEDYNPLSDIAGYEKYSKAFVEARSPNAVAAIKRDIDRQLEDRKTIEDASMGTQIGAIGVASLLDPVQLIVGIATGSAGGLYKASTLGAKVTRAVGAGVVSGAAVGAVTEVTLQSQQDVRTTEESVLNVVMGAVTGGIISGVAGGVGHAFSKAPVEGSVPVDMTTVVHGLTVKKGIPAGLTKAEQQQLGKRLADELSDDVIPTNEKLNITARDEVILEELGLTHKDLSSAGTRTDDTYRLGDFAEKVVNTGIQKLTPVQRMSTSDNSVVRELAHDYISNPFFTKDNLDGIAATTSVEDIITQRNQKYQARIGFSLREQRSAYNKEMQSTGGKKINQNDFNIAVGKAVRSKEESTIPAVRSAVAEVKVAMKEIQDDLIKNELLTQEQVDAVAKGSSNYLTRIYDFSALARKSEEFKDIISEHILQGAESAAKELPKLETGLKGIKTFVQHLDSIIKSPDNIKDIDKLVSALSRDGSSLEESVTKRTRGYLTKKVIGEFSDELRKLKSQISDLELEKGMQIKELDNTKKYALDTANLKKVVASLGARDIDGQWTNGVGKRLTDKLDDLRATGRFSKSQADAAAWEVWHTIRGNNGILDQAGIKDGSKLAKSPYLQERSLNIDDALIEDFLVHDIESVMTNYTARIIPQIENKKYDITGKIEKVRDEWNAKITAAKEAGHHAKAERLEKQSKKDIKDVIAMKERLEGTRGMSDPDNIFHTGSKVIRDLNFMTMLGQMTVSAIPDMGRQVQRNGLRRPLKQAIPFITSLFGKGKLKATKKELRNMGIAIDVFNSSRINAMADITQQARQGSKVDKYANKLTSIFSMATGMNHWNDFQKIWASLTVNDIILTTGEKLSKGKGVRSGDIKRLAQLGLGEDDLKRAYTAWERAGKDSMSGSKIANWSLWDDGEIVAKMSAATFKDSNMTIVTPTAGDKPLWFDSGEAGKIISQFQTFAYAAHNKVTLSGMQNDQRYFFEGAMVMTMLGVASWYIKDFLRSKEKERITGDETFSEILMEGIDRSGFVPIMSTYNKFTSPLGADTKSIVTSVVDGKAKSSTRMQERNVAGILAGPTAGTAGKVYELIGGIKREVTGEGEGQWAAPLRRLLPFNNLFIINWLFDDGQLIMEE